MIRLNWVLAFMMVKTMAICQPSDINTEPRKGSYLYYPQPAFEDNSFLLEEAITQEKGIMQYTSNFYFDNLSSGNFLYGFSHEIPLGSDRHQISYLLTYYLANYNDNGNRGGRLGDLNVRPDGSVSNRNQQTLNPGFRFAIDHKRTQIVPGMSAPIILANGKYDHVGLFFYLSFEMEYLPFHQAKDEVKQRATANLRSKIST